MIQRIVAFALKFKPIIILSTLLVVFGGAIAFSELDIEAYPNPCPPLVETLVQPMGWSAEEVERYVTIPMEVGLSGIPGLTHLRSISLFSLSDVKCYFQWGTDYWADRQEVINRMTTWINLPPGQTAQISPWNAIGEVFRYTLEGKGYTLSDKKTAEDWLMEHQWRQVQGVVDVTSYGGTTKQYHVDVDPYRLKGHGVTLTQTIGALQNANVNVGGQRMSIGEQTYDVRGIGMLGYFGQPLTDIEDVTITQGPLVSGLNTGTPVRVRDVADVSLGYAPRLGMVGHDEENDVVQGIVLMKYGGQAVPTLEGVMKKVQFIEDNNILPPGMKIVPYYDRGHLTKLTIHTVLENVLIGMALVVLVLILFLSNVRAALITALNIPLALTVAVIGLVSIGASANLLSLGAVDFGIIVDSSIIMMENIFRRLGPSGKGTMSERVLMGAREVGTPMMYSTIIIGLAFLPLFTLVGVPGAIFGPMARTYAMGITGGIIFALTLTPVLATKFVPAQHEERENFLMRFLHKIYNPFFDAAIRRPKTALAIRAIPIFACIALFPLLGRDFMPKLEEGNIWLRATMPMSISLEKAAEYTTRMRRIVRGCPDDPNVECTEANRTHPEVTTVISQLGRPDDGTDVTGYFNLEIYAPLKPFEEWRRGYTKDDLIRDMNKKLAETFPGVIFNFSQYILDNVEEATAGVKGANCVKIFGPDIAANDKVGEEIVDVMRSVRGIEDLGLFRTLGQPDIKITPDRKQIARYGLNTGDIANVVQSALGGLTGNGSPIVEVYEGEKYFDLTVRWKEQYRSSIEAIREIPISTPAGFYVPLGQVAKVEQVLGPINIYREDLQRYAPVKFAVRDRDLAGAIAESQQKIKEKVHLAYNQHLDWQGEIQELKAVEKRLMIIIPLTILLIGFVVYIAVGNWLDTAIILIDIPVACTGGILALLITGTNFSVSAAMGFVSVFGIAVQDALLMVTYYQRLHDVEGLSIEHAAREAS
ncbi:MAG TPA: efflux RND transporter permease subunit, partial [Polyangiaceae bacterium]|nr:efflux RND transporter permease subunit [Polyangiaceae bacterium]